MKVIPGWGQVMEALVMTSTTQVQVVVDNAKTHVSEHSSSTKTHKASNENNATTMNEYVDDLSICLEDACGGGGDDDSKRRRSSSLTAAMNSSSSRGLLNFYGGGDDDSDNDDEQDNELLFEDQVERMNRKNNNDAKALNGRRKANKTRSPFPSLDAFLEGGGAVPWSAKRHSRKSSGTKEVDPRQGGSSALHSSTPRTLVNM